MNRHLLVGRFGATDTAKIEAADDEVVTRLELLSGTKRLALDLGYAIDTLTSFSMRPSETGVDLAILAAHVYAADTRISRRSESQDGWSREIRLVVPVLEPKRWYAISPILIRMLNFLTGDRWSIGFRPRPTKFARFSPTQASVTKPIFDGINLFSGGLDSLIGAIDELEQGKTPLLVSHAGEGAASAAQEQLATKLKRHYKTSSVERLRVWLAFPRNLVKNVDAEDSTRGRSFLFFALGAFAGTGLGAGFVLRAPENGFIALNIPLDHLRLGALSTRTTHPFYIERWNDLLKGLSIDGKVENPYWSLTKGEMVRACRNQALLRQLTPLSLSCASPTKARWMGHGTQHCGHCIPCIIRRASLHAAYGAVGDSTTYTVANLRAAPLPSTQAVGEQVRSLQLAIQRVRAKPDLTKLLVHKSGPLTDHPDRLTALSEVYRRGLSELGALLKDVVTHP
jgi:hypothetical protein